MSERTCRIIAWGGLIVLLGLHYDFWRASSRQLLGGWLPVELAWRLGWMILAWLYLLFFCRWIWRESRR